MSRDICICCILFKSRWGHPLFELPWTRQPFAAAELTSLNSGVSTILGGSPVSWGTDTMSLCPDALSLPALLSPAVGSHTGRSLSKCSQSLSQFLIKVLSGSFPPLPVTGSQGLEHARQRHHHGATSLALQPVFISKETKDWELSSLGWWHVWVRLFIVSGRSCSQSSLLVTCLRLHFH